MLSVAPLLATFLTSLGIAILFAALPRRLWQTPGAVQDLHRCPTPRLGGLALAAGWGIGGMYLPPAAQPLGQAIGIAAALPFAAGLAEDVLRHGGTRFRLAAALIGGLIFVLLTGYRIQMPDLPTTAGMLVVHGISTLLSALAIGGAVHAVNLVDGANGLAAGTAIIALAGMAAISVQVGDRAVLCLCLTGMAGLAGLFVVNFPQGRIFLGDGGAYALGALLACLAIALPARNAGLSPLCGLLALCYPACEMVATIHRRLRRKRAVMRADRLHLHSLVHRDLARRLARRIARPDLHNAATSVLVWSLGLLAALLAVSFAQSSLAAACGIGLVALAYRAFYRSVSCRRARLRWHSLRGHQKFRRKTLPDLRKMAYDLL